MPTTTTTLPVLSKGATGPDVQWLQYLLTLKTLDWNQVDGIFGQITETSVQTYQTDRGLTVDGIVGPQTWAALHGKQSRPPILAQGASAPVVARLQNALNIGRGAGFAPAANPDLAVDGDFGPITAQAVRGLQRMHDYTVDAAVGLQTWATPANAGPATLASLCQVTAPTA